MTTTSALPNETPSAAAAKAASGDSQHDFEAMLRIYYERLFPLKKICRWLSCSVPPSPDSVASLPAAFANTAQYFAHREFSFTLADDVYLRFQSFGSAEEMAARVARLQPHKIDIGAVYTARPADRRTIAAATFKPVEKELVIDIDMTDYDDVRRCCQDKAICSKCWKFVAIAVRIIDAALLQDFGFKHRLWVFSGRRGIHCWVCDAAAKGAAQATRKAVLSFLEVLKGGNSEDVRKKVHFGGNLHPSLERARGIIETHFDDVILTQQNFLSSAADCAKVLQMIADDGLRDAVRDRWARIDASPQPLIDEVQGSVRTVSHHKWNALCEAHAAYDPHRKAKFGLRNAVTEIMFQLVYPRIDTNVSVQLNHLLKSPFCVHPATGKVCVPVLPDDVFAFDPHAVPTLRSLVHEIDYGTGHTAAGNDILKTSLKPYVDVFSKFISKLEADNFTVASKHANAMDF